MPCNTPNEVQSKRPQIRLNQRYKIAYLKGKKKKSADTVEHMKGLSAKALAEREEMIKKREENLRRRETELQELILLGRRVKASRLSDSIPSKKTDRDSTARKLPSYYDD